MLGRSDRGKGSIGAAPWTVLIRSRRLFMGSAMRAAQVNPPSDVTPRAGTVTSRDEPVTRASLRLSVALGIGLTFGLLNFFMRPETGQFLVLDLDISLAGARELLAGRNPYLAVGPHEGMRYVWPYELLYPVTAMWLVAPVAWLPIPVAGAAFVGLSNAALAFALSRRGFGVLAGLAGAGVFYAGWIGQWGPLLTAAVAMGGPALLVLAAKPSIGLALWCYRPTRTGTAAIAAFVLLTVAVSPWWPAEWLRVMRVGAGQVAPVMLPGGFLILLALLRWRRPEARLLAALACVPHTLSVADTVPLLLVARTRLEAVTLAAAQTVAYLAVLTRGSNFPDMASFNRWSGTVILWTVYAAALVMVLRRPNKADA
jgi:hypothetical protein